MAKGKNSAALAEAAIMERIKDRFASSEEAHAWYAAKALLSLSGKTARELVQVGRVRDVMDYIDAIDAGVHA